MWFPTSLAGCKERSAFHGFSSSSSTSAETVWVWLHARYDGQGEEVAHGTLFRIVDLSFFWVLMSNLFMRYACKHLSKEMDSSRVFYCMSWAPIGMAEDGCDPFLILTFIEFISLSVWRVWDFLRLFSELTRVGMELACFGRSMTGISSHYSLTWTGRTASIFPLMQTAVCATCTSCTGLQSALPLVNLQRVPLFVGNL